MFRLSVAAVALVLGSASLEAPTAQAEIWGIKTHDPFSGPPSTLFRFDEDGSSLTVVGTVHIDGLEVDVDGLAIDGSGTLYGFVPGDASGLLVTIDRESAAATGVGWLGGREIRGATFTADGELLGIDLFSNALVRVDPATGAQIGPAVPLTLEGMPFDAGNATDLAVRADGLAALCRGTIEVYEVDLSSGVVTLLFADPEPAADGFRLFGAGLGFPAGTDDPRFIVYDVNGTDDIFAYASGEPFTRSPLYTDIIDGYNAGRGDLASFPGEPISEMGNAGPATDSPWLLRSVPNPSHDTASIAFVLSEAGPARLDIYSADGRRITHLLDRILAAGRHQVWWGGHDEMGRPVPAGTYVIRLESSHFVQTQRITRLR